MTRVRPGPHVRAPGRSAGGRRRGCGPGRKGTSPPPPTPFPGLSTSVSPARGRRTRARCRGAAVVFPLGRGPTPGRTGPLPGDLAAKVSCLRRGCQARLCCCELGRRPRQLAGVRGPGARGWGRVRGPGRTRPLGGKAAGFPPVAGLRCAEAHRSVSGQFCLWTGAAAGLAEPAECLEWRPEASVRDCIARSSQSSVLAGVGSPPSLPPLLPLLPPLSSPPPQTAG